MSGWGPLSPAPMTKMVISMRSLTGNPHELVRNSAPPVARPITTGGTAKRALDLTLVFASLPFVLPVMLLVAALVYLASPGPIFYAHRRVGQGGREFRCLKFRTMVTDGDQVLQAHLRNNPHERLAWEAERKLQNDPRVTPVGAVLRKSSLDELPQLLNVLKGEMSLVGPRPVVRDELVKYGRSARYYLVARPGLTGLWQISGRNDISYARRVLFDRFYVTRWTLLRDLWIVAMTVPAVLASKGAR